MSVDVIVTGRSIPALISALDFAEVGMKVCLANEPSGVEPPRQPLTDPEGAVRAMLQRVATPIDGTQGQPDAAVLPRTTAPLPVLLRDPNGAWAPLSTPNALGIPASPLDAKVIRLVGTKHALRAYVDRIRPVLTLGKTQLLSSLVRQRMGQAVLDRVVDPLALARFGVTASEIDVAAAAPGLNEAITRQGSLSTAVLEYSDRAVARETLVQPVGGGAALHAELMRKLALYEVQVADERIDTANWTGEAWAVNFADGTTLHARALVLDSGRSAVPAALQRELCPELSVNRSRVHAVATFAGTATEPFGTERIEHVPGWSVLSVCDAQGTTTVTAISDVRHGETAEVTVADVPTAVQQLTPSPAQENEWSIGVAAAPFATIVARETAETQVDEVIDANPFLLPVGRSLYGDDLGLALERSSEQTVQLRRRLLGLID